MPKGPEGLEGDKERKRRNGTKGSQGLGGGQKTEEEEVKQAEYEQATSLLGKLDEKEQQMVMRLKATQAKESVAKVEL